MLPVNPMPPSQVGETVLVVEDDPAIRWIIVATLRQLGYETLEAKAAPDALDVLQSDTTVDLIIADIELPGALDGHQVANLGKALRPDLEVLLMTGHDQRILFNGRQKPDGTVLGKPFAMDVLGAMVVDILHQRDAA